MKIKKGVILGPINFIVTFCYVGYVPFAPGSVASLVAAFLFFYLPSVSVSFFLSVLFWGFILGAVASGYVADRIGSIDPSQIVIDEVMGMWVAVFLLPKTLGWYLLAFLLFRFFDILKPFPINLFENFSRGFGIMSDDLVSGFLSFFLIWGIRTYLG